jgi:hypothetical protein
MGAIFSGWLSAIDSSTLFERGCSSVRGSLIHSCANGWHEPGMAKNRSVDRVVVGHETRTRLNFPLAMARHLFFAPLCDFSFGKLAMADVENSRAVASRFKNMFKMVGSRASLSLKATPMADPQDDADRVRTLSLSDFAAADSPLRSVQSVLQSCRPGDQMHHRPRLHPHQSLL